MLQFDDYDDQDLGKDFIFESDPNSLQRILDNRELSPRSVLAMRMSVKLAQPSISPAKGAPRHVRNNPDKFDFFESKQGDIFWKPKTLTTLGNSGSKLPASQQKVGRQRALGRKMVNALPQRCLPTNDIRDPRTTMSSRKPLVTRNTNKGRRSCMPEMMVLPMPRQSISERKAIPGLDNIPSRLPSKPKVRKELNFDEEDGKENQSDNDEDNFAKPFPVPVSRPATVLKEPSEKEKKSLAQMILMRESLAGLPRASLSGLFRQSLSIAELDRMFEDDSTESFEDLEKRLKTPAKLKSSRIAKTKTPIRKKLVAPEYTNEEIPQQTEFTENTDIEKPLSPNEISAQVDENNLIFETVIEEPTELPKTPTFSKLDNVPNKTPTTIHKYGDQDVLNVEIIEYEIDDSQIEDEEIENQLLQRSMSVNDLSTLVLTEKLESSEKNSAKLVPLARSLSMNNLKEDEEESITDLKELNPDSSFLKSAVESLEEHRQEQATIEQQIQNLMEKSLKRREQFRAVWGVSPKSINQKRDLKTVLNVQNVKFSTNDLISENQEENFENYNQMENEMFGLQIHEKNNIEDEENNEQQKIIDSEMFQQFIDANFPASSANNLSYAAHNFTGIDITTDGTSLDEIFVDPIQVSDNSSSVIESLHKDLETPELLLDDDMETEENAVNASLVVFDEDSENFVETNDSTTTLPILKMTDDYENSKKSKRKSVRFLNATPDGDNHKVSDIEEEQDIIQENTITLNLNGLTFKLPQTPIPKDFSGYVDEDEDEETFFKKYEKTPVMPTPMALHNISKRAQEAFASLYNDEVNDNEKDVTCELQPQTLDFNAEDSD